MRYGIDIDGVLAQFTNAYGRVISQVTGLSVPSESDHWPSAWYWERALGVTPAQEKVIWQEIKDDAYFWLMLPLYDNARAFLGEVNRRAEDGHEAYFITVRQGYKVKQQTERWLHRHGISNPTVLIAKEKGRIAAALKLDWLMDDRPENLEDTHAHSHTTQLFLVDKPWNRSGYDFPYTRITSPMEAL